MSSDAFQLAGITYCVALAGFLTGCTIAAAITEPSHDPFDDYVFGDIPALPGDLKVSRFHSERNKP